MWDDNDKPTKTRKNLMESYSVDNVLFREYSEQELIDAFNNAKYGRLTFLNILKLIKYAICIRRWLFRAMSIMRVLAEYDGVIDRVSLQMFIDEYDYGTTDPEVIAAVKHFLMRHPEAKK